MKACLKLAQTHGNSKKDKFSPRSLRVAVTSALGNISNAENRRGNQGTLR